VNDLQLALPTGALIAGDAAALFADARPVVDGLPTGCFPATVVPGGVEVRLTGADAEPVEWGEVAVLSTPSGYAALLDVDALAAYTDLGDEPVDEFELLAEHFDGGVGSGGGDGQGPGDVAEFQGVLAVRGGSGKVRLSLGRDSAGVICRIALKFW
jgi:hypothetical protein